jgi:hypothetical protein
MNEQIVRTIVAKVLWKKNSQKDYVVELLNQIKNHKDELTLSEIMHIIEDIYHDPQAIKAVIRSNILSSIETEELLKKYKFYFDYVDEVVDQSQDSGLLTTLFLKIYRQNAHEAGRVLRRARKKISTEHKLMILTATKHNPQICGIL